MDENVQTVPWNMPAGELAERIAVLDPLHSRHKALPIVDEEGLLRAIETGRAGRTVLEVGSSKPITAFPDESLHDATVRMLRHHVSRLPVVSRENPRRVVGYLGRAGILSARVKRIHEEHVREPGWISLGSQA